MPARPPVNVGFVAYHSFEKGSALFRLGREAVQAFNLFHVVCIHFILFLRFATQIERLLFSFQMPF